MHFLRLASFFLGVWLAGSLMALVTPWMSVGLSSELVQNPNSPAAELVARTDAKAVGLLLRHQSLEAGRRLARRWELVQLMVGSGLLACLFLAPGDRRYSMLFCILMLGCVVFLHWFLSAEMRKLIPAADFALETEESLARDRLRSLQSAYTIIDGIKLGLGVVLAAALVRGSRRRRNAAGAE